MVSEDKVKLMTKCAIYEKHYGKTELRMAGYFKKDYIKAETLKTLVGVLVAFAIGAVVYVLADYKHVFSELNQMHFIRLFAQMGAVLLVLLVLYFILSHVLYAKRYDHAKKHVIRYYRDLKQLKAYYHGEEDVSPKQMEEGDMLNDEFIDY